ncbi:CU044_5270 family protein [Spirillospora sp. NPDC047279]|uniref:CU044_5270 family protein n=1 Tax=Spirillospora sp. NPDC047279 TaxID=3155478 RepID=UPI0033C02C97
MNDDITEVRRLLAPANPSPRGALTGAAHDAAGRAAFARVTAAPPAPAASRAARFSPRRRLVAAGGLAVAVTAAVAVAPNLGGTDGDGRPRSVVPAGDAQVVLAGAASAVQSRPFTEPRPNQWIYDETRYRRTGNPLKGQVVTPSSPYTTVTDRSWTRADGIRVASFERGKLVISPTGGGMPPIDYASVSRLPRDPDALLAWARRSRSPIPGDADAIAFRLLSALLQHNAVLPPEQEKAIYQAMAKVTAITLDRSAVDAAGRPALSVGRVVEGYLRQEVLLDRATYAYRGHRTTVIKDHTMPDAGAFTKGTIESQSVRLAAGIVDVPGRRP